MTRQSDQTGPTPTADATPVSIRPEPEARRKLRRSEAIALSLITALMAAAWVMMLKL